MWLKMNTPDGEAVYRRWLFQYYLKNRLIKFELFFVQLSHMSFKAAKVWQWLLTTVDIQGCETALFPC